VAVTRDSDERLDHGRCDGSGDGARAKSGGRVDNAPQRAVQTPLPGEGFAPATRKHDVSVGIARLQHLERRLRRELSAPQCESQSIPGNGIDKSSGVSSQQQACDARRIRINGQGPEDRWRGYDARPGKTLAQPAVVIDAFTKRPLGIVHMSKDCARRNETGIDQPAIEGGDAQILTSPNVHFPERRSAADALKIAADGPPPRSDRMTGQP
jgi:hypothetical protein